MMVITTSPPTAWIIEIFLINGVFIQNITLNDPTTNATVITSLTPANIYMIRVAGISDIGVGNFTDFATAQTYQGTLFVDSL